MRYWTKGDVPVRFGCCKIRLSNPKSSASSSSEVATDLTKASLIIIIFIPEQSQLPFDSDFCETRDICA
ncbi:hypothetical protein GBA52_021242 [Prunus armeniaca]|nr:hypothetical protein GBA52_021242 [Prunus armeniaca]